MRNIVVKFVSQELLQTVPDSSCPLVPFSQSKIENKEGFNYFDDSKSEK